VLVTRYKPGRREGPLGRERQGKDAHVRDAVKLDACRADPGVGLDTTGSGTSSSKLSR